MGFLAPNGQEKLAQWISLAMGPLWPSWEKFRAQGQEGLAQIKPGTIGTLTTRNGQYRILTENDFQHLLGVAREVERVQSGLPVIMAAVQAVQLHRDEITIKTLVKATALLGDISLPTRGRFEPLKPEGFPLDPDDEVELDPAKIHRPYANRQMSGEASAAAPQTR